jgi:transcriptional regulator with XRE-family HTH domain
MTNIKTPGERLRYLRETRGWSAEQLAKQVDYSTGTIWHHENGTRNILSLAARKYANALGVTDDLILNGQGFNQEIEKTSNILTRKVALLRVPLLSSRDIDKFHAIAGGARPMSEETVFASIDLPEGHRVYSVLMPDAAMAGSDPKKAIFPDETVFINPDATYKAGDVVAATMPGYEEILIRKYRRVGTDATGAEEFDLVPLNPDESAERQAGQRGAKIVGKVIGAYRVL